MFFWFFVFKKIEFTKKIILVNLIPVSHDDRSSNESFDGHYCKYFVQKKNFSSRLEYHLTNLTRQFFFAISSPKVSILNMHDKVEILVGLCEF